MLNPLNALRKTAAIAALILFGVSGAAANVVAGATPETYTWSAKLVAYDEAEKMATVQAMVVGDGELTGYSAGDRIVLTWSGITTASGIRSIARGESGRGRFEMPVEFAAIDGRYVTFRVPVPTGSIDRVKAIEPGQWVTSTSPQPAPDPSTVVVEMRGFTDVG